jgi:hypothetical protein
MRNFKLVRFPVFILALLFTGTLSAQDSVRTHEAIRLKENLAAPIIDGNPSDYAWNTAPVAQDFIQAAPNPGKPSRQNSDVRILYDDDAFYLRARMFDSSPDSILHQLGPRDEWQNNTDAFAVMFDPYHDRRNAFFFAVTAAGVQTDARYVFDKIDVSLNAVWYSAVSIDSGGWTVEMKIPYQALRFPKTEVQTWGVNYNRVIRRYREQSWWNTVDQNVSGVVNQSGDLTGIKNIDPPVRLALFPYVSGYYELYDGEATRSFNGGLDVKYGLSDGFTLDLTLIPDFGQTISDNLVLNLSPFEVRYDERRYFFTEGTELFNRNDLFYSRRIGARPAGYSAVQSQLDSNEFVVSNPANTRLYNAIKISGRTKSKTGLGFFNAVSAESNALVENSVTLQQREIETSPLTNFNCFVVEQIIGKYSYVGYMNTTVLRSNYGEDAMVNSVQFRAANSNNKFAVEGYVDHSLTNEISSNGVSGFRYHIEGGKVKGPLILKYRHHLVSNTFDSNDMGYLDRNNYYNHGATIGYNVFTPFRRILWTINEVNADVSYMYDVNWRTFFTVTGRHIFTFRNFITTGANWLMSPVKANDFFETRTQHRYLLYPENYELGGFVSSDYRKILALDASSSYRIFLERNRTIFRYSIGPRYRASDNLFFVYKWEHELKHDNIGYVYGANSPIIVFGLRDMNTVTNTLTTTYIFTPKMGLSLRVRHYWSEVSYKEYFDLQPDGTLSHYDYSGDADISFNAFNIDLIYTWVFQPGSELIVTYKNSILSSSGILPGSYSEDLGHIFDGPESNSISVKLIWYLDAGKYFKKK